METGDNEIIGGGSPGMYTLNENGLDGGWIYNEEELTMFIDSIVSTADEGECNLGLSRYWSQTSEMVFGASAGNGISPVKDTFPDGAIL